MPYTWKEHRFLSITSNDFKCSRKCAYMRHRRYLSINHKFRSKKEPFNGKSEHLIAPTIVQVSDIFIEIEGREEKRGKSKSTKRKQNLKKDENLKTDVWKKRSILFNLPYWKVCAPINLRLHCTMLEGFHFV